MLIGRANKIIDDALAKGEGDFVEDVAAELPLQAIADLLGVPFEDRRKLFDWSNQMLAGDDPEYGGQPDVAAAEILGYAMEMAADRQGQPARRPHHQAGPGRRRRRAASTRTSSATS